MSQDVRMFVACTHIIDGEVYDIDKCPRCYGRGWYFDIYFDSNGHAVISEGTLKLQQELLKITLEEKTGNPFFLDWGNEVNTRMIGQKNNPAARAKIELLVRDCIDYLKNVQIGNQTMFQNMEDSEIISTIDSINVVKSSQTGYEVEVIVTSRAGENIAFDFEVKL